MNEIKSQGELAELDSCVSSFSFFQFSSTEPNFEATKPADILSMCVEHF